MSWSGPVDGSTVERKMAWWWLRGLCRNSADRTMRQPCQARNFDAWRLGREMRYRSGLLLEAVVVDDLNVRLTFLRRLPPSPSPVEYPASSSAKLSA